MNFQRLARTHFLIVDDSPEDREMYRRYMVAPIVTMTIRSSKQVLVRRVELWRRTSRCCGYLIIDCPTKTD